ncbi:MAG: helix-turn-helix transcriptional regulator [Lentisphaerae bacterium]|nr:helix-turn-helix transcriptional regulator [Lentisphaerota bacterium]
MSIDLSLKKFLGDQLKQHMKNSKVRQLTIAKAMGVTPSAVSQMLSGKMTPSMAQLNTFLEVLKLDPATGGKLRECLAKLRSGDTVLRSPLNEFIFSQRTERCLSLDQLAFMTGIPVENLSDLENRFEAVPSPHEATRLAAVFNCAPSDIWSVSPDAPAAFPGQVVFNDPCGRPEIAGAQPKSPVINFADLAKFDSKVDNLMSFAWRHMIDMESSYVQGTVYVIASGEEVGWSNLYSVKMQIADYPAWLPGMIVMAFWDDKMALARTERTENVVVPLGSDEEVTCQWYWTVGGLQLMSGVFEQPEHFVRKIQIPQLLFGKRTPNE